MVAALLLIVAPAGCGSGSGTTGRSTVGHHAVRRPTAEASPGVGWKAPITKTVGPRHVAAGVGRLAGLDSGGSGKGDLRIQHRC